VGKGRIERWSSKEKVFKVCPTRIFFYLIKKEESRQLLETEGKILEKRNEKLRGANSLSRGKGKKSSRWGEERFHLYRKQGGKKKGRLEGGVA